jgi:chemotaxis protein CheD
MNAVIQVNVHIGEIKIVKKGETLKTILGSCVGIGIIWKKRRMCGLAHCLLAESPVKTFSIGGRFVDQAVPSLIALMKIRPENLCELEIILVGGGNMTQPGAARPDQLVGSNNFRVAERELQRHGLRPTRLDHAGEEGRRLTLHSRDGTYAIETIPRFVEAA